MYEKKCLFRLPLLLTFLTLLTPGIHASDAALESLVSEEALLNRAIIVTEDVLSEISATWTLSSESLNASIDEYSTLAEEAFRLLPESLQSLPLHIMNAINGIDPKILQCAHVIRDYEDKYYQILLRQLITAGYVLTGPTNLFFQCLGFIMVFIPSEYYYGYFSTAIDDDPSMLIDCEKHWKKSGLKNEHAQSISEMLVAIQTSPFRSAAMLKIEYENLAELHWSTSHTWTVIEWEKAKQLFLKIQKLVLSFRQALVPTEGGDEYSVRITELSKLVPYDAILDEELKWIEELLANTQDDYYVSDLTQ